MKTILIRSTPIVALSIALTACASSDTPSDQPSVQPSTSAPAAVEASTEQAEAQPRLVVAYADGVEVLSLAGTAVTSLSTLPLDGPVNATVGPDGRHVYLVNGEAGVTSILDSGSYAQGHGDHFHFYTRDAAFRADVVEGPSPVHIVGHDGIVAVFNDGDGSVDVFDEIGLTAGGITVTTIESGAAHHGVAVPIHEGLLYTALGEGDEGPLPDTIVQSDLEGNVIATYADVCPGLHGEASMGDLVVFGCATGAVVIDTETMTATQIANPADAGELRIGSFYADADSLVGNWGTAGFTLIDTAAGTIAPVAVDGIVVAMVRGAHGEIIVLSADGTLRVFDESGAPVATVQVVDAFEPPQGHGAVRPTLTVVDHTIVVSDPAGNRLVLVDAETWTVASEVSLAGQPTGVVATGLAPAGAEEHTH